MANSNMTPSDVKSVVNSLDQSCPATNEKAIQSGTRLGGKAASGGHKESGFKEGKKGVK